MAEFKDRLKEAMQKKDMSAAELSRAAHVNEGAISQYLKGAYKANQKTLEKLAAALNVSIPWLMGSETISERIPTRKIYLLGHSNKIQLNQDRINAAIQKAFAEVAKAGIEDTPDDKLIAEILDAVSELNEEGKKKVLEYINDLSDKYREEKK